MPSSSSSHNQMLSSGVVPSSIVGDNHLSVLSDVSESMMPPPSSSNAAQDEETPSAEQSFVPISSSSTNDNPTRDSTTTAVAEGDKEAEGLPPSAVQQEASASLSSYIPSEGTEGPRFKDQSQSFLDSGSGNGSSSRHTNSTASTTGTLLNAKPPATYKPNIIQQDQEVTPGLVEAQAILIPIEEMELEEEEAPKPLSNSTVIPPPTSPKRTRYLILFAMICAAGIAVLVTCTTGNCSSSASGQTLQEVPSAPVPQPTPAPPPVDPVRATTVASVINGASFTTNLSYPRVDDTAEALSLEWLIETDPLQLSVTAGLQRLTQRYAMGVLWFALFGVQPPDQDECGWDGVRACVNGLIGQLQMERVAEPTGSSTEGTLPPDLGLITQLTNVSMPAMNLRGTLPESFSRWTALEELYLEQNQLTGTLPAGYQTMKSLRVFSVHENLFNGTIPSAYAAWTSLERLFVSENQLSGSIPEAWPFLQDFWCHDNDLTGPLPASTWVSGELRSLVAYNNQLSGSIPQSLATNDLVSFELHQNLIDGTIPEAFSRWTNSTGSVLKTFYVFYNDISGQMPLCETAEEIEADIVADCTVNCTCCRGCVS